MFSPSNGVLKLLLVKVKLVKYCPSKKQLDKAQNKQLFFITFI